MAFVVQDPDTPTSDANAYISVADFQSYHDDRGQSYGTATDEEIEQAIVRATDYMDVRWTFEGVRYDADQSTECPRAGVIDPKLGWYIEGIPSEIIEACAEYALTALNAVLNDAPTRDSSGARVTHLRTRIEGAVEREVHFDSTAIFREPIYPIPDAKMRKSNLLARPGHHIRRA